MPPRESRHRDPALRSYRCSRPCIGPVFLTTRRGAKPDPLSCPRPRWRAFLWTDRHRSARDSGLTRIQPTSHSRVHRSRFRERTYERMRGFTTPDTPDTTARVAALRGVAVQRGACEPARRSPVPAANTRGDHRIHTCADHHRCAKCRASGRVEVVTGPPVRTEV